MTTKVHSYLGGLGIDATNKLTLASNATVTIGNGTTTGNIHSGGNIAIGNISPRANALAVGGDVTVSGTLDIGIASITNDLSLSGGDGALRFPLASSIKVLDNNAAALVIEEADTAYMTIVTTDGSEAVKFDKPLDINGAVDISGDLTLSAGADGALRFSAASSIKVLDNSATSLVIEEADAAYMTIVTTNGSEAIKFDKALDINAAIQLDATLTIGANDQGYDVILYGDTASANMTWDTSADDLIFNGAAGLIVPDGQLTLGATAVTSTAAEVNQLDAITRGSIIYGNASAATARLAKGAEGTVLTAGANDISWEALEAGVGYQNSSTSTVPGTDNTDLGNLTDASEDAFGIASSTKYDLMDPIGSLVSLDLGAF
jgi:hypothetical protein